MKLSASIFSCDDDKSSFASSGPYKVVETIDYEEKKGQ